jgi:hypothetical protein
VEAKIGDTYYATFAAAYAAAKENDTITLLTDIEASEVILIDKSLTINGNEHKITSTASRVIRVTTSNVEVTLNKVNMVSNAVVVYPNDVRGISIDPGLTNVKLTLENCSVDFTDASANDWTYAVNISGNGNGHTLTFKMVDGSDNSYHSAIKFYTVNLTIKDLFVVLENKAWGSQLFLGSNVTWIGGGFEAQELCFVLNHDGSLNIESGEFYTRGTTNSGFGVIYFGTANKTQSLTISGGTFNAGAEGAGSAVIVTASTTKPVITITGGTFIGAPDADVVIDINSTTATLYLDPSAVTVIGGTVAGLENSGNTLRK